MGMFNQYPATTNKPEMMEMAPATLGIAANLRCK
jgi:hypothetical protein